MCVSSCCDDLAKTLVEISVLSTVWQGDARVSETVETYCRAIVWYRASHIQVLCTCACLRAYRSLRDLVGSAHMCVRLSGLAALAMPCRNRYKNIALRLLFPGLMDVCAQNCIKVVSMCSASVHGSMRGCGFGCKVCHAAVCCVSFGRVTKF